ncbi:HAD-IA family hydrolase [Actinoplanes sp. NPDC049598]
MSDTNGALVLLQWAAIHAVDLTPELEAIQEAREHLAITTARPTPHSRDVILAAKSHGMRVAIVSNNSKNVILRYLLKHDLAPHIDFIAARERGEAHLLKPSPALLLRASETLDIPTQHCVMLGDTTTDITAANRAHMPSVGFATKPERAQPLALAGASTVFHDMKSVVSILHGVAGD